MHKNQQGFAHTLLLIVVAAIVIGAVGFTFYRINSSESSPPGVDTGVKLSIDRTILDNRFGFLTGHPGSEQEVMSLGGRWGRPHPGPFLWDSMQDSKTAEIDFSNTDEVVKQNQSAEIATLATIWPFAEWDQGDNPDCAVSDEDEFLPPSGPFDGAVPYLPEHRCNPVDTIAYQAWLTAVVERYDGDGQNDMPDLKIPVKYWEVMNEPDLRSPPGEPERLSFYKQGAEEYAALLIDSHATIKEADSEAQVLIAGAAGGSDQFLDFYHQVLNNPDTHRAFDIANVHCISNDEYQNFNVVPYKAMLRELGLDKPIWVTEAEAIISKDIDTNATQTLNSTRAALEAGAERIFFTRYNFDLEGPGGGRLPPNNISPTENTLKGDDPEKAYQAITSI